MPALPLAAGMVIGIIAAELGGGWLCAAISAVSFAVLYACKHHYAAIISVSAAAGAMLAIARSPQPLPEHISGRFAACSGTLVSASIGENAQRCVVSIDSVDGQRCSAPFGCVVYNRNIMPGMLPGSRVRFSADISPLKVAAGLPYEADYDRYLKYDGITSSAIINNASLEIIGEPNLWHRLVNDVRESMADGISHSGVKPTVSAFLLTAILGEDDFLSPDTRDEFRSAGLSHILALSGLHVGIITSFLVILLFPLRLLPGGRRAQSALTITLIWIYAIATGLGPSVTRAAVMLTALILSRLLERGIYSFNSLYVALIVVLAINPYSLFTPGLQMSFAAVGAILLAMRIIPTSINRRPAMSFLLGMAVVPVAAMLGTGIVGAYYFHELPLLFLPANIAMAILFPLLLVAGITLMMLTMTGLHAAWLASAANFLYDAVIDTVDVFAGIASARGIFFTAWAIVPYWIGLIILFEYLRRRLSDDYEYDRWRRPMLWWGAFCILLATAVGIAMQPRIPRGELYLPDANPAALIVTTPERAYLWPIGRRINPHEALERYNSRYATYLMSRGHSRFELMPDGAATGPFARRGPFLIAGDKLIVIADADTITMPTSHPHRILIGQGFNAPLAAIASSGDTIIICRGVNGNRAASLRRQCADTLHLSAAPFSLTF